MVGEWGRRNIDYPATSFWEDYEYEYAGSLFSTEYEGRAGLFEGLSIWEEEKYRNLQGTYPVISLSFAGIQESDYETAWDKICEVLRSLYIKFSFLLSYRYKFLGSVVCMHA